MIFCLFCWFGRGVGCLQPLHFVCLSVSGHVSFINLSYLATSDCPNPPPSLGKTVVLGLLIVLIHFNHRSCRCFYPRPLHCNVSYLEYRYRKDGENQGPDKSSHKSKSGGCTATRALSVIVLFSCFRG